MMDPTMLHSPHKSDLLGDLGLLAKAVADAFRTLAGNQPDGYWAVQRRRCENC